MKTLFLILLCVPLAFFPLGVKKFCSAKKLLYKQMLAVIVPATISLITHAILLFTKNKLAFYILSAFYFISSHWIGVAVTAFFVSYTSSKWGKKILKFGIIPLSIIDSALFIFNIFVHVVFYSCKFTFLSQSYMYYQPELLLLIHFIFSYGLYVYCFVLVLIKYIKEPVTLRVKYNFFLVYLTFITVSNIFYFCFRCPLNFLILIYAFCFVGSYNILVHVVPNALIQKTLGIISNDLKNGIVLLDNEDHCIYTNEFITDNFERNENNILEAPFFHEYFSKRRDAELEPLESFSCEVEFESERRRMYLLVTDFFIMEEGVMLGRYYLVEDITSVKNQAYEEKLLRTRDPLTELYNKDYFFEKVAHRLKFDRFTRYYLIISDIVNFKLVNDLHGKPFGDTILKRSADAIRRYSARDVIYGRLYNDHFIMLVPKRRFDESEYREAFKKDMSYLQNFTYNLVVHMGIYEIDDTSLPVSVMCDRAFLALKTIKNDYKTAFAYYNDHLRLEVLKMQMLMNELPMALKSGQLKMYLQPQVNRNGELSGAEALVRWHHPERGIIPPGEFIEIIEKINIISDVDRYIWECACKKLSEWKKTGKTNLTISVNISGRDFFMMDLFETFVGLIKKYDISPKNLNLEITETAVILDIENQTKILDRLRSFGFVVEMDDFGSGYSSLNMLKDISVDVLKIDMEFLKKSKNEEKSQLILEKIIMLAKDLGMRVITEGVENSNQVAFLSEAGSDLFQGFYFSRPVPVDDFEQKYF